MATPLKNSNL